LAGNLSKGNVADEPQRAFGKRREIMIQYMQMQALKVGYFAGYVDRENLPPPVGRRLGPNAKSLRNEAAHGRPVTVSSNGLTRRILSYDGRQGP
jgi:hypothetical protein